MTSHVGKDQWEKIQKENSRWLMQSEWNGKKYALESYCSQHRAKFLQLQEASNHVTFQVPNEHTRVGYLIDNIKCSDAALQAAIAKVRTDTGGARDNFEQAVTELLPVDPYTRNKANTKTVTFANVSTFEGQPGRGVKTGVDLRWYEQSEYQNLSKDQKAELTAWRATSEGKSATKEHFDSHKGNNKKRKNKDNRKQQKKKFRARVAALEKELEANKEEKEKESKVSEIAAALKEAGSAKNSEEKNMSIARTILGISARKD